MIVGRAFFGSRLLLTFYDILRGMFQPKADRGIRNRGAAITLFAFLKLSLLNPGYGRDTLEIRERFVGMNSLCGSALNAAVQVF